MTDSEDAKDDVKSIGSSSRDVDGEDASDWKEREWNGRRNTVRICKMWILLTASPSRIPSLAFTG